MRTGKYSFTKKHCKIIMLYILTPACPVAYIELSRLTGWVKKANCCTVIDISRARQ